MIKKTVIKVPDHRVGHSRDSHSGHTLSISHPVTRKITHKSSQMSLRYEVGCWLSSEMSLGMLMFLKASSNGVADTVIEISLNTSK